MSFKKEGDRLTFKTVDQGVVHDVIDSVDTECDYSSYRVSGTHNFTDCNVDSTSWIPNKWIITEIKMLNPARLP